MPNGQADQGEETFNLALGESKKYGRQEGWKSTFTFKVLSGTVRIKGDGKRQDDPVIESCGNRCKVQVLPTSVDLGGAQVRIDSDFQSGEEFSYEGGLVLSVTAVNGPASVRRSWTTVNLSV